MMTEERTTDAETFARENCLAYTGDVDCAAWGGSFLNLNREHHENGYIECLRVQRLDDAPFSSLILLESLTLLIDPPGSDHWNEAATSCGHAKPDRLSRLACKIARTIGRKWKPGCIARFLERFAPRFTRYIGDVLIRFAVAREMRDIIAERKAMPERERVQFDAELSLWYGRYDPAEMGYDHHTFAVLTEELDEDALETLRCGSLEPQANVFTVDEDGDVMFDEALFFEALQDRADATFSDMTSTDCLID